jgi:Cu/Ag efflux protein CusF
MAPSSPLFRIPVLAALAVAALAGWGLYRLGVQHGAAQQTAQPSAAAPVAIDPSTWTIPQGEEATRRHLREGIKAGSIDPVTGRKILYYHDPMVPGARFDAPAKSPFMNMMLVPAYAGSEGADSGTVTVSPRIQQNLGMRTALVAQPRAGSKLPLVPTEAVIHTGKRSLVMLAEEAGHFRPVQIEAGAEKDGFTEVKRGLQAGQKVVVSGQFLIDSEASLRGLETRLQPASAPDPTQPVHRTPAKVEAIDKDTITLTHPEIPALKWPVMTMDFKLPAPGKHPPGLKPGDDVEIEFRLQERSDPLIVTMRRAGQKP